MKLTILMPCLNEALTLPACIEMAKKLIEAYGKESEILISDNGSTDGSQSLAESLGARGVRCSEKGYGNALNYGILHAKGDYILMGDADCSYHFDEALPMIEALENGADVCMGTRLKGKIMPGAMPFLNRYLGNPVLTAIGKYLFSTHISDFHCGMRAFRKDKILKAGIVSGGMEWASEMVINCKFKGLKFHEIPITLYPDQRNRKPHMRRWRDGWRHLMLMLTLKFFDIIKIDGMNRLVLKIPYSR